MKVTRGAMAGAEDLFRKGVELFRQKRLDNAARAFLDAIEIDPDHANSIAFLAGVRAIKKEYKLARDYAKKALAIDAKNAMAHLTLGKILDEKDKDVTGAVQAFERAVALDPLLVDAWFNIGQIKYNQHDWDGAIEAFGHVTQIDPSDKGAADFLDLARKSRERDLQKIEREAQEQEFHEHAREAHERERAFAALSANAERILDHITIPFFT
nr:tetratricopeptide repeat protein [Candidatus Sigynarchaeum springense]